jgi:preprotein translocase SecF subunit
MKGFDFIPHGTKIAFVKWRKVSFVFSSILLLASLALFFTQGLNYGIDFRGGGLIEVRSPAGQIDIGELRTRVSGLGLGDVQIQEFGSPADALIRIEEQPGGEKPQQEALAKVKDAIGDLVEYRRTETVGPTVSKELKVDGAIAVLIAIACVLVYIWLRFEWQFSVGAVVALVHDVGLTIGIFSLIQMEFGLSIVAAILTIVGYSLNDTVVVFDRIRENLRKYKKMPLKDLLDLSVNETLSRTLLTSLTTMLALLSLYVFGGEVIRGFTFAMIWGVVVGTYSSIFIATPVLLLLDIKRDWSGVTKSQKTGAP